MSTVQISPIIYVFLFCFLKQCPGKCSCTDVLHMNVLLSPQMDRKHMYFVRILYKVYNNLQYGISQVYPYSSGLLHWHWGNHMIAPVPVKQPWRIWVNDHINMPVVAVQIKITNSKNLPKSINQSILRSHNYANRWTDGQGETSIPLQLR